MGVPTPQSGATLDLTQDPRWKLAERIARSPQFQKTARLRDFLFYVVENGIRGKNDALTEQHIGCAVFERPREYSPADDNIVRVHARQLRLRLEEYFLTEGREEPLTLEIPKGTYVPAFRPRALAAAPPAPVAQGGGRPAWLFWGAVGLAALLLPSCILLLFQNRSLRQAAAPPPESSPASWMLEAVCDPTVPTSVVVPDSGFGTLRGLLGRSLTLDDYLQPGYPSGLIALPMSEREREYVRTLTARPYTTFPVLVGVTRLAQIAERRRWPLSLRFARDLTVRDFSRGNFVLLGSAISNPWVSLYERELNFRSDWDTEAGIGAFRNSAPRAGEALEYAAGERNARPGVSFGTVSLLLDRGAANVLILQGVNMEGTEAAAEFAFDPKRSLEARQAAGASAPAKAGYRLEILLRTKAMAGAARDTSVVATRYSGAR